MNAVVAAVLRSETGDAVPLKGVAANGRLTGLLFELSVEQTYANNSATNIEAEYTFPVPHRAVLLGLELQIGERALQAVAVRRQAARESYEEAMDKGDTAVLLEQAGDGLYSLSLGNLLAGERAVIRYRYAELLDRHGDELRLSVPTVIAPRYGAAEAAGLAPHQVPGVDLLAEYPFALTIDVLGEMAAAVLRSPSHKVQVTSIEGGRQVSLAPGAFLDRDFVLSVSGAQTRSATLVTTDGEGYVALLSLDTRIEEPAASPLALKLVVDCSGSMGGESIACARRALLAILDRLGEGDQVSVTRFGSTVEQLVAPAPAKIGGLRRLLGGPNARVVHLEPSRTGPMTPVSPGAIEWLRHQVRGMDADLGGTELAGALRSAIDIPLGRDERKDANKATSCNILLITDAEVWEVEQVLEQAAQSGYRVFVVAVGAAPAEALVRQIGEKTGGACEFVSPSEDVEAAIVRMFRRMREAPKRVARVEWPAEPAWQAPLPVAVFSGDTLHVLAGFKNLPAGEVRVVIAGLAEGEINLKSALTANTVNAVLPRLAAAKRLSALAQDEAAALAEQYQLASAFTSYVVVQVRDAEGKATQLPELRAVPQMLAAGWGASSMDVCSLEAPMMAAREGSHRVWIARSAEPRMSAASDRRITVYLDAPAASVDLSISLAELSDCSDGLTPQALLRVLANLVAAGQSLPETLDELSQLGVPEGVIAALRLVIHDCQHLDDVEAQALRLCYAILASSPAGAGLDENVCDELKGTVLGDRSLRPLRTQLGNLFTKVSVSNWAAAPEPASLDL